MMTVNVQRARAKRGTMLLLALLLAASAILMTGIAIAKPRHASAAACTAPAWSASAAYSGGAQVTHQNKLWQAKWWTSGEEPGTTGQWGVWEDKGACDSSGGGGTTPPQEPAAGTIPCSTASCLHGALKNVQPGQRIALAAGTYTGSFSSAVNGTAAAPITIESADPNNPAILSGYSAGSGYALQVTGDYWVIRKLKFTNAQKGIMLDNANHALITGVEVYNIGYEGVHFRDGSSHGTIENSHVHDTGKTNAGFGEGVYVGSADGASYNPNTHHNTIRNVVIGPNVTAEHIDIKERTIGTLVEYCTFYGEGISGANYADSFIDVKGNEAIIRNNVGYQNDNNVLVDAFQLHEIIAGWGINNQFMNNTVHLTNSAVYVVGAYSNSNAIAKGNTRSPAGNMYRGNVTVQ
ncbi:carbohydrate-binding protein [Paenibacillus methanolicus]|uniref:Parallel beta helix pectate lyase-like protein n=1 Tax=Paenibacillus methanolicus TaxID=582686 RepID=A0A5S5C617_9BACL|nr:carbohydrate-binding protein [Paenibacillus methanolicus]TYP74038.1 parallel beta helix pectate lyase-like protein [Paenibacillus methanolicus]